MLGTGGSKIDLHSRAQPSMNSDFSCDGFRMTRNPEVNFLIADNSSGRDPAPDLLLICSSKHVALFPRALVREYLKTKSTLQHGVLKGMLFVRK